MVRVLLDARRRRPLTSIRAAQPVLLRYSGITVTERLPIAVEAPRAKQQTEVGSYFVATYPPFSVW